MPTCCSGLSPLIIIRAAEEAAAAKIHQVGAIGQAVGAEKLGEFLALNSAAQQAVSIVQLPS